MKAPDDVSAMLRLKALGWGSKRIASELGCSRNTVRHWLAQGDWRPCASPSRSTKLDGLSDWLRRAFSSPCRQCRCGAPGAGAREEHHCQSAHGGTRGSAAAA